MRSQSRSCNLIIDYSDKFVLNVATLAYPLEAQRMEATSLCDTSLIKYTPSTPPLPKEFSLPTVVHSFPTVKGRVGDHGRYCTNEGIKDSLITRVFSLTENYFKNKEKKKRKKLKKNNKNNNVQ